MLDNEREFLVLARELNFVRAADMLHISQPTLTRHIAYLEKELGFKLFNRSPMSLTEAGQTFCTAIGGIIDQLDASVDSCRRIAAETSVGLLINIILSSNNKFADIIYEAMTVYHDKNPYSPMPRLYQNHQMSVAETVYTGKTDVGIVFTEPSSIPEGFGCQHLLDLPLMVYLHESNPLARRESITVEELENCYLVCPASPHLRSTFEGALETMRAHGIEPKYRVREVDEFDRIPSTIQIDEMLFKTARSTPTPPPATFLRAVRFCDPVPEYHVYALYRDDKRDHGPRDFVETCRALIAHRLSL